MWEFIKLVDYCINVGLVAVMFAIIAALMISFVATPIFCLFMMLENEREK